MKTKLFLAALALLAVGAGATAQATTYGQFGYYKYHGAGPNYYLQTWPGQNCLPNPHPTYGWVCY